MTIDENKLKSLFYCQNCNSDPFTLNQRCLNFNQTLEQFHNQQGHVVVPYVRKQSIIELFTQAWQDLLPQNISELKQSLKLPIEGDIDKQRTINSDSK